MVLIKILAEKSENLSGRVNVPSSKSHTLRAVIFGTIASGKTIIRNPLISPDAKACIKACRLLGAEIDASDDKEWAVEGTGGKLKVPEEVIDVGNSGIALRLISGVASNCNGSIEITGEIKDLYKSVKNINIKLWNIEDKLRICEKNKYFDKNFIELARGVYFANDERAKLKSKINKILKSNIREIKQYDDYKI